MQLRSGHVTLLRAEFQPTKFSPVGHRAPGNPKLRSVRNFFLFVSFKHVCLKHSQNVSWRKTLFYTAGGSFFCDAVYRSTASGFSGREQWNVLMMMPSRRFTHLKADGSFSILIERFEDVMSVETRICFSVAQVMTTHDQNKPI